MNCMALLNQRQAFCIVRPCLRENLYTSFSLMLNGILHVFDLPCWVFVTVLIIKYHSHNMHWAFIVEMQNSTQGKKVEA